MEFYERARIISCIAQKHPEIGKTAIMKCVYFLQELKKVPLDYDFEIYTYGPYSSEVMEEIDFARQTGLIEVKWVDYPNGMHGYQVSALKNVTTSYDKQIEEVVNTFGSKTAKELELLSTILFVQKSYNKNKWGKNRDSLCATVQEIKPRFSIHEIEDGFDYMNQYLSCAQGHA